MEKQFICIPDIMKNKKQWALHVNKCPKQISLQNAKSNDSDTWNNFDVVLEKYMILKERDQEQKCGISYALNSDLVGIDLDNCFDNDGKLKPWAENIVMKLPDSYIEYSLSGKGLHIFNRIHKTSPLLKEKGINVKLAEYPALWHNLTEEERQTAERFYNENDKKHGIKDAIEIYTSGRFLTITGNVYQLGDLKKSRYQSIKAIINQVYEISKEEKKQGNYTSKQKVFAKVKQTLTIQEIIKHYSGIDIPPAGGMVNCVFHEEKTDSLFIYTATNSFYCWGCNVGGDIINYVKTLKKLSNREALEDIIEEFNLKMSVPNDDKIRVLDGHYETKKTAYGNMYYEPITNFVIEPLILYSSELPKFDINIVLDTGEVFNKIVDSEVFDTRKNFLSTLNKVTKLKAYFTGTDKDLEIIKTSVFSNVKKEVHTVNCSGIHKLTNNDAYFYIDSSHNMIVDDIYRDDLKEHYVMNSHLINSSGEIENYLTVEELKNLHNGLIGCYDTGIMLIILGFLAACPLKARLRLHGKEFPHLFITGESQTGKSSLKNAIITPFFSVKGGTSASAITNFVLNNFACSSNTAPLIIDEFKTSKMMHHVQNMFSNFIRNSYDGVAYFRGNKGLTVTEYEYLSPVVLVGENATDETALRSRWLELFCSSRYINKDTSHNFKFIERSEELIKKLGAEIIAFTLKYTDEELLNMFNDSLEVFDKIQPRTAKNITVIDIGLKIYQQFLYSRRTEIKLPEDYIKVINKTVDDQLSNGFVLGEVDRTIELMDSLADSKEILNDYHYRVIDGTLALPIKRVYPMLSKYIKNYNTGFELEDKLTFTKKLKSKEYYIDTRNIRMKEMSGDSFFNTGKLNKQVKCVILNLEKLNEAIPDLEVFSI